MDSSLELTFVENLQIMKLDLSVIKKVVAYHVVKLGFEILDLLEIIEMVAYHGVKLMMPGLHLDHSYLFSRNIIESTFAYISHLPVYKNIKFPKEIPTYFFLYREHQYTILKSNVQKFSD